MNAAGHPSSFFILHSSFTAHTKRTQPNVAQPLIALALNLFSLLVESTCSASMAHKKKKIKT